MKHAEPESSPLAVQLLRHALSLDLSVAYAPDGQVIVSRGTAPTVAMNDPSAASEDFVGDDANEDFDFEEGLRRIEYWAKWAVSDDYPVPGEQNWRRWAWEFLRRNEQYALLATWMNGLPDGIRLREEPEADDLLEHVLCNPAPLAGQRTIGDYMGHCRTNGIHAVIAMPILVLRHCWGVNWPLSPNDEFQVLSIEEQTYFFSSNTPAIVIPAYLAHDTWMSEFPFQEVKRILSTKEVLLKFDLTEPLHGQFELASERLHGLRRSYFMKSRFEMIAPGDLDSTDSDEDLSSISDPKNYTKALQFKLRIFDAANINGGFLSRNLCQALIKTFVEEFDIQGYESNRSQFPETINAQKIKDWYCDASKLVSGDYKALVRYKPLTEAQKQKMRDRKQDAARK